MPAERTEYMDGLKTRLPWLFGGHYKMERFGISFAALCLAMIVVMGTIVHKHGMDMREVLGTQVMYTTAFTMSRSHATGTVQSVHVSEDGTQCLLMLHWDDMTNVATDAEDYQLFLTGSNLSQDYTDLLCEPVGRIYMFGNSGYMAVYLVDVNGFQSQILDLVIRSNNDFLAEGGAIADTRGDGSFLNYDQARIYFNPGGESRTTADCLEDGGMDAFGIYDAVVTQPEEASIREQLDAQLLAMHQAQAQIEEAEDLVEMYDIQLPMTPEPIRGDTVTGSEEEGYELNAASVLPGGYDYDWRNGSVREGYLDGILAVSGENSYSQLAAAKAAEVSASRNFSSYISSITWYYADGEEFVPSSSTDASTGAALASNAVSQLTTAWTNFYNAKYNYQVTFLGELLALEVEAQEMTAHYTVAQDMLTLY